MNKIRILIVAVCAVFILCSCAGGRMALNAKDASYPVSATQYLHDNNGILTSTYEVLYHFQKDYSRWSILWTAVPFSPYEQNIAADLDSLVQFYQGNAVVNVTAKPNMHPLSTFIGVFLGSMIPIIPSGITMRVEGDIVRYKK